MYCRLIYAKSLTAITHYAKNVYCGLVVRKTIIKVSFEQLFVHLMKKMSKLYGDVLYLILQELQDDKITLHSCLLVNKTWCEMVIPILWKNPWKNLKRENEKLLLNVI